VVEIKKAREPNPPFNLQQKKSTFIEARREFVANDAKESTSKTYGEQKQVCDEDQVLEILQVDQTSGAQQKKVSYVMTFSKTMLGLLNNEEVVYELTRVITMYEKMPETIVTKETSLVGGETLAGKVTE